MPCPNRAIPHFIPYGVCPSAVTMSGFLLGRTTRLRVGTAVSLLPLHHPVHLAEQAALLDHLSGRRFCRGVGEIALAKVSWQRRLRSVDGCMQHLTSKLRQIMSQASHAR